MKELFLIDRMSINGRTSNESILSKALDIGKLMVTDGWIKKRKIMKIMNFLHFDGIWICSKISSQDIELIKNISELN